MLKTRLSKIFDSKINVKIIGKHILKYYEQVLFVLAQRKGIEEMEAEETGCQEYL